MPKFRIPEPWRKHTDNQAMVEVSGRTAGDALNALTEAYPDLRDLMFDNGKLITGTDQSVNIILGKYDFRELNGTDTPVSEEDRLLILRSWPAAMSGPQGG